jgi:REP element-mobilizing transposase RayT
VGRNRKVFIRDKTYFITFRAEQGMPFPATRLMNKILEGILCKAKLLYQIDVVNFKFMSNHVHLIITVICPESVDSFIQYLKRESAHSVNRLLGRRKRTIWCEGYDSPIILDLEKLLDLIAYVYANASKADLCDSIEKYPGLSSWHMFLTGQSLESKRYTRDSIPVIGAGSVSLNRQRKIISELESNSKDINRFTLSPYAFLKSFETDYSEEELKEEIIRRVRILEEESRRNRSKALPSQIELQTSGIELDYLPKKFGKRMICLSTDKTSRAAYISWYKQLCEQASTIYREFKNKLSELFLPPGVFSPGGYLTANIWGPPCW